MKRTLVLAAAAGALLLAGCSSETTAEDPPAAAPATSETTKRAEPQPATAVPTAAEPLYGVTQDGLTTAVNIPANVSGSEFEQGCAEAKAAIAAYGDADVVLALLQSTPGDSSENVTVEESDAPWAEQTPQDQANVIAMIRAAAAGEC